MCRWSTCLLVSTPSECLFVEVDFHLAGIITCSDFQQFLELYLWEMGKTTLAAVERSCDRISTSTFRFQVIVSRAIFTLLLGIFAVYWVEINILVEKSWSILLQSPVFRHDSFEPVTSSLFFALNITWWMIIDFHIPYLHKYRIQITDTNNAWKGREVALYQEALWYLFPWIVFDIFCPRRNLPTAAPSLLQICSDVVLSLLAYDLLFFIGHNALHKSKILFARVHSKHHHSFVVRAPDSIRHTFIDGQWDVLCSVIGLKIVGAHPLSRTVYNFVATMLITEAHSGINFPWSLHNLVPFGLVAGPVLHDLHHRNGNKNFQQFFTYLDWIFGSLQLPCDLDGESAVLVRGA